jgi:hypothetical protein
MKRLAATAEFTFFDHALVLPMTEQHPLAVETATAIRTGMAATLLTIEGRKRSSGKPPTTFQSLYRVAAPAPIDTIEPSKARKSTGEDSPTMESAAVGRATIKTETIVIDDD